jgi:murein DD-endopeptidase MepM/ murein hydrolase activator NlpD
VASPTYPAYAGTDGRPTALAPAQQRPTLATLATDAVRLSPVGTVADAATLAANAWQYLLNLITSAGRITNGYLGPSRAYADGKHHGVDIGAPAGSPIRAPVPLTLVAGPPGYDGPNTLGHGIYGRTDDGHLLVFGHALKGPSLPLGTKANAGQVIGQVGSSGNSTGPHIHLQVLPPGVTNPLKDVDPLEWLRTRLPPLPGVPLPPLPPPFPQPGGKEGPGAPAPSQPAPAPGQPQTPGQVGAEGPPLPTLEATLASVGPWEWRVDLSWLLRLALTVFALLLILYGVFKLADVEGAARAIVAPVTEATAAGRALKAAIPKGPAPARGERKGASE